MVDLLKFLRQPLQSRMTHISWMIRMFLRLFSAGMQTTCGEGMRMIAARGMKISEKLTIAGHKHVVPSKPLRNCNFFKQRTAWRRGIVCFYHEGENDVNVYWTSRSCQCFRGEKRRVFRCELKSHFRRTFRFLITICDSNNYLPARQHRSP